MRPTFEQVAFDLARDVAQRSTCPRLHTGAVICTPDNRVVATGYNGSLPGTTHCEDEQFCYNCDHGVKKIYERREGPTQYFYDPPLKVVYEETCAACNGNYKSTIGCLIIDGHCRRTVHAEANAILQAAQHGPPIKGCTMYSLHTPCLDCTKLIISAGIKMVIVKGDYRPDEVAAQLQQLQCNLDLFRWSI